MLTLQAIFMELSVFCLGFVILLIKLLAKKDAAIPYSWISAVWFAATAVIGLVTKNNLNVTFEGVYFTDGYSLFFKLLILVCAALVALSSHEYIRRLGYREAEYYALLAFTTLGMMVFAAAGDFVTLYVGLEVMTMAFIVLIGFVQGNNLSTEAAFKYLILSALSSAVMLYGMGILYGVTGTTVFMELAQFVNQFSHVLLVVMGLLFFLAGFAYKLSAVPFHMWAPDIYQGAPTPVAGFLAVGSKVATLGVLCRVLFNCFADFAQSWLPIVLAFAMLSIIFGNLVAIPQRNIKRMLAYSSIAQVGYLLLAVAAVSWPGIRAMEFYATAYALANLGAFIAATSVELRTGITDMNEYAGMHDRSPLISAALFTFMVSLGGLPLMAGFVGKFLIFTAAVARGYLILAVIALLFSMISVYYYFSLIRKCYFAPVIEGSDQSKIVSPAGIKISLWVCMILSVALGVFFNPVVEFATNTMQSMLFF